MQYFAFDQELFACVAGIRHFRYMLEGHPFTIFTDHKPLTFALGKVSERWTAMQYSRDNSPTLPSSQQISGTFWFLKTSWPTLCRPPRAAFPAATTGGPAFAAVAASPVSLDYAKIAANKGTCQEMLKAAHSSSLMLQYVPASRDLSSLWRTAETSSERSASLPTPPYVPHGS
jgi:hypothetical protein